MSLLFHEVPGAPGDLTRRVGLAAVDACRETAGIDAVLKWPNDVLVGERKLGGILAERGGGAVVVGLGLNVGWAPPGAAKLGADVDPLDVLAALLAGFDRLPTDISTRYRQALATLGRGVRLELLDGVIDGTATDVDPDGRLVVVDRSGRAHTIDVGDVTHLR